MRDTQTGAILVTRKRWRRGSSIKIQFHKPWCQSISTISHKITHKSNLYSHTYTSLMNSILACDQERFGKSTLIQRDVTPAMGDAGGDTNTLYIPIIMSFILPVLMYSRNDIFEKGKHTKEQMFVWWGKYNRKLHIIFCMLIFGDVAIGNWVWNTLDSLFAVHYMEIWNHFRVNLLRNEILVVREQ